MSDQWCWVRIKDAVQRNSNDKHKCMSEVLQIVLESCLLLVLFVVENLIGFIALILGLIYLKDCPINPSIPLSLSVFGVFSIIHGLSLQLVRNRCVNIEDSKDGFATLLKVVLVVSSVATLICFIWVAIVIYDKYSSVQTRGGSLFNTYYCHPILYWFGFVFVTIVLVLILIILALFCCSCCFVFCGTGALMTIPPPTIVVIGQSGKH